MSPDDPSIEKSSSSLISSCFISYPTVRSFSLSLYRPPINFCPPCNQVPLSRPVFHFPSDHGGVALLEGNNPIPNLCLWRSHPHQVPRVTVAPVQSRTVTPRPEESLGPDLVSAAFPSGAISRCMKELSTLVRCRIFVSEAFILSHH